MTRNFIFTAIGAYLITIGCLFLWPIGSVAQAAVAICVVWILAGVAYRLTAARSSGGWYTLLACATALTIGVILNTYTATTLKGVGQASPIFDNWDMEQYWKEGEGWMNHNPYNNDTDLRARWGYGFLIYCLWKVSGGINLFNPLIFNSLLTLLSIVVSGVVTRIALIGSTRWSDTRLQIAGMIATASVTYFLFSGTLLLREALSGLSIALMALGVLQARKHKWADGVATFLIGSALIALFRASWMIVPCIGAVMIAGRRPYQWGVAAGAITLFLALWLSVDFLCRDMGNAEFYGEGETFIGMSYLYDTQSHQAFNRYFGELYFNSSPLVQLLFVPFAAVVQFVTPFPWSYASEVNVAPTLALVKFTYPWYAIGGLTLYYIGFIAFTAIKQRFAAPIGAGADTNRLVLWGAIYWLGTVWASGGSVARYGVPLLPLVIPAAVWVLAECRQLKAFKWYSAIYIFLLAIALIAARIIQSS